MRGTEQYRTAEAEGKLLRLPTGDGGALAFCNNPEAPVLCAEEIAKALKSHPEIRVRMGIHSGPVNEVTDLNEQANVAGAGINIAQRVMDCGDADHILVSKQWCSSSSSSCATSSATIIPSLALPMSIIGTFSVMYLLHYSLDNLSLMALTLAVGFVVDDAIVMLKNIVRQWRWASRGSGDVRRGSGGRLHDPLDDVLARRGVHPVPVHGRHHRAALKRVRGDHRRGGPRLGPRVVDAHADAGEPVPQVRSRQNPRPPLPGIRTVLRRLARPL